MSTARQEIEAERSAHANAVETLERLDRKLHRTFLAPIGTMLHGLSLACSLVYSSRSHEQVLVETRQAHRVKISVLKNQSQFSDPEQPGAKQSCHMWGTINQAELQCHKENIQVLESDLKESKPQAGCSWNVLFVLCSEEQRCMHSNSYMTTNAWVWPHHNIVTTFTRKNYSIFIKPHLLPSPRANLALTMRMSPRI